MASGTVWESICAWIRRLLGLGSGRGDNHPQGSPANARELELEPDDPFEGVTAPVDPALRYAIALLETGDSVQLHERWAIASDAPETPATGKTDQFLPLLVELTTTTDKLTTESVKLLDIPDAYFIREHPVSFVTGRLSLDKAALDGNVATLVKEITALLRDPHIKRIALAVPVQPSLEASRRDIGIPDDRRFPGGTRLDGADVVIGIVDDGCAFAERSFLEPTAANAPLRSRIKFLWDQSKASKPTNRGWRRVAGFPRRGYEIDDAGINAAFTQAGLVVNGVINEDAIYRYLHYPMADVASHGTHVMDIAAGNGRSLALAEGVAPSADIIFVQLPADAVEAGGTALTDRIQEAVYYIFDRAERVLKKPVVVNISYGGFAGPHDGSTVFEQALDQWLGVPDRAAVIAAGNGFEANCHAELVVAANASAEPLRWQLTPDDPTVNNLEIWYDAGASLELTLTPPDGVAPLGPIALNTHARIRRASDQKVVGRVDHGSSPTFNGDNLISIVLRPTARWAENARNAPPPYGTWQIALANQSAVPVSAHVWIERDAGGKPGGARRRQSRLLSESADPRRAKHTLADIANGKLAIVVGAYNAATEEVCRYSACGPTRATGYASSRSKPDLCAPADELVVRPGILSASSGSAQPTRMNGTSAAAPHVTGLVALMFQYVRVRYNQTLAAARIGDVLRLGATQAARPLKPNLAQAMDPRQPVKQQAVWNELVGSGRIDAKASIDNLP